MLSHSNPLPSHLRRKLMLSSYCPVGESHNHSSPQLAVAELYRQPILATDCSTSHKVSLPVSSAPLLPFNHTLATSYVPRYSPLPNAVQDARSRPPLNNP